jgi:phosphoribosyl-AMP cyclohydrolase
MNTLDRDFFRELESSEPGKQVPFRELVEQLRFNDAGLVPVIAQDVETGAVLMLAWMNRVALEQTISTGFMTYWSRSRQKLWLKGETSGHYQSVQSISFDCDGDAVLCKVRQEGSACHTGRKHCFYLGLDMDGETVTITSRRASN